MMKARLLIIALLLFSLAGWAQGAGSQKKVHVDRQFDLSAGGEVLVKEAALKVRFGGVLDDSRCPEGVDCIWAGNARITVTVRKGKGKPVSLELNTMTEPKSVAYEGYEITLVKLSPYPKNNVKIKKGAYVATLMVKKK